MCAPAALVHVSRCLYSDYEFSYIEKDYLLNMPHNNTYWPFPFRFVCFDAASIRMHLCSRFRVCIIYDIQWAIELVPTSTREYMLSAPSSSSLIAVLMHRSLMFAVWPQPKVTGVTCSHSLCTAHAQCAYNYFQCVCAFAFNDDRLSICRTNKNIEFDRMRRAKFAHG